MSFFKPRGLLLRLALPAVLLSLTGAAVLVSLPGAATAAEPASNTTCAGKLANDSSGKSQGEDNLLDYTFSCDTEISAYTIIADRVNFDGNNIDDYSSTANVVLPTPYAVDPSQAGTISTVDGVNCGGAIPSNGINCYGTNGSSGLEIGSGDLIEGNFDLTNPYCSYLPKGAKAGTPAVPRAVVELVVTDNTGAQDGPFELTLDKKCAKVAAVVPAKKAKKTKKKSTKKKK